VEHEEEQQEQQEEEEQQHPRSHDLGFSSSGRRWCTKYRCSTTALLRFSRWRSLSKPLLLLELVLLELVLLELVLRVMRMVIRVATFEALA
jgi:hypothetical protein